MSTHFFFGYGSLVNRGTHDHDPAHPARIAGWRRVWRHLPARPYATLSVEAAPDTVIDGLIAGVAPQAWAALDRREAAYRRHDVSAAVTHAAGTGAQIASVAMYVVPHETADGAAIAPSAGAVSDPLPILLSYLDVVVQGYHQVFGAEGVAAFFDTTRGWHAPVHDDRAAPIYPRHQALHRSERRLVDQALEARGVRVLRG